MHGRRIEYRYLDDGYDLSRTIQATRRLVQQDRVFAMFNMVGTEQNLAVRAFLNAARVPQLFGGPLRKIGRERPLPLDDGVSAELLRRGAAYARHLIKSRPGARVAVLHEASDYGRDLLAGFWAGIAARRGSSAPRPTRSPTPT